MNDNTPATQKTMLLNSAGGESIHVRPEAFALLDLWISHSLDELEGRWAHFSTRGAAILRKRTQVTNQTLSKLPKNPK